MTSSFKNFRGRPASIYEINGGNIIAGIADLGASVQYLKVKTEQGWLDLCPGFDDAEEYISSRTCFGATIGRGLFIDHGSGVIIGETTVIGDNVTLYQGVTLGGTGKEQGKRHPTLEDNVMVSAGAKILGSFTIGENSKIGAGSVVLEEVPPNCTVVGVPGRIVRMDNKKVPRLDMDQVHLPDPVLNDIRKLQDENIRLHNELRNLMKELRCIEKKGEDDEDL